MKTITHTNDSLNVVYFAQKYPGWHSYAKDKRTERAVERAAALGRVEISRDTRQFRLFNSTPSNDSRILTAQLAAKIFQR